MCAKIDRFAGKTGRILIAVVAIIVGATGPSTSAPAATVSEGDLMPISLCNESESDRWCVWGEVPRGQILTLIENPKCRGTAGQSKEILVGSNSGVATEVDGFKCKETRDGAIALLAFPVESYMELEIAEIANTSAAGKVLANARTVASFRAMELELSTRTSQWAALLESPPSIGVLEIRHPRPYASAYLVSDSPLHQSAYLDDGKAVRRLFDDLNECSVFGPVFSLNGFTFIQNKYGACFSDGADTRFFRFQPIRREATD